MRKYIPPQRSSWINFIAFFFGRMKKSFNLSIPTGWLTRKCGPSHKFRLNIRIPFRIEATVLILKWILET